MNALQKKLDAVLDTLKCLDANGWCIATDGSLAGLTTAEKIAEVRKTIAEIRANA